MCAESRRWLVVWFWSGIPDSGERCHGASNPCKTRQIDLLRGGPAPGSSCRVGDVCPEGHATVYRLHHYSGGRSERVACRDLRSARTPRNVSRDRQGKHYPARLQLQSSSVEIISTLASSLMSLVNISSILNEVCFLNLEFIFGKHSEIILHQILKSIRLAQGPNSCVRTNQPRAWV